MAPSPPSGLGETDAQWGIVVTTVIIAVLTNVIVALRIYTRKFIVKDLGWDDWTILAAQTGNNFGIAVVLIEIHFGFGRHRSELSTASYILYQKYGWAEWIQTFQTLMFTKISLCLFLLRIVISRNYILWLWSMIWILLISNIILTLLWILQCRPVWLAWESPSQPGSCMSEAQLLQIILAQAIISAVSDFALAATPILIIRRLKMTMRTKVGLSILMGLGAITGILCVTRSVLNWENINSDSSWNVIPNWHIRTWEVQMGILATCVPSLHPGWRVLRQRWRRGSREDPERKSSEDVPGPPKIPPIRQQSSLVTPAWPLPATPSATLSALPSDNRRFRNMLRTEFTQDSLQPPVRTPWGRGGRNRTNRDLEAQRAAAAAAAVLVMPSSDEEGDDDDAADLELTPAPSAPSCTALETKEQDLEYGLAF